MSRKQQVEQRRQHVLDAAEALIREEGSCDFPMTQLADRAGLSQATPYNLFGSKASLLYTLLNRCMDEVERQGTPAFAARDPYQRAMRAAGAVAGFFASDPNFFRPLYRFLIGASDPLHRPAYMDRGLRYWRLAVAGIEQAGHFDQAITLDELARELEIHFVGVLDLWVQSELESGEFLAQTLYGTGLLLMAVAPDRQRNTLRRRLAGYRRQLPRDFSFSRASP